MGLRVVLVLLHKPQQPLLKEADDALRELQQLRSENARLKKMYANPLVLRR